MLFEYIKKDKKDFCEGCSFLGLYRKDTDDCIICEKNGLNEDEISSLKFKDLPFYQKNIGYFLKNIAAWSIKYQQRSSAGGLISYLTESLLKKKMVDGILSVAFNSLSGKFEYKICTDFKRISEFQRSAYYPVDLQKAIELIDGFKGTLAITCIPSAAKAIEIIKIKNPSVKKKVKYVIGLVCGHVKTENYVDYLCKKSGKKDGSQGLTYLSFRDKLKKNKYSGDDYYFVAKKDEKRWSLKSSEIKFNWSGGLFKQFSSDFDDDVFAECSDITVMDGWLKKYRYTNGVSLAIVRNKKLMDLLGNDGDLKVEELTDAEILASQSGGIRHKRNGLSLRLALYKIFGNDVPKKRVEPKFDLDFINLVSQVLRLYTSLKSNIVYEKEKDPHVFDKKMRTSLNLMYFFDVINRYKRKIFLKIKISKRNSNF